jgi:tetratricopeptide (TPR) repeat protein
VVCDRGRLDPAHNNVVRIWGVVLKLLKLRWIQAGLVLCVLSGAAGIWALLHPAAFWPWRPERSRVSDRPVSGPSPMEAELANVRPKEPPPQSPLGRASLAFDEGRFEDCLHELAQARRDGPDASSLEGWARYRLGQAVEARAAFERAVREQPDHWDARVGLGYSALRGDDLATAEREFGLVHARQPHDASAIEGLGYVRNRQGEHADARDLFAQALALAPGNHEVRALYEKLRNAERHVVLVIVDGLRPDAVIAAPAPRIQELATSGASTMTAKVVGRPETVASFATILTGLSPKHHGVFRGGRQGLDVPTLFTRVRETGGRAAFYPGKGDVVTLAAPGSVEVRTPPADSAELAGQFARDFPQRAFELAVIHLREPDLFGHQKGWMTPDYLAAVRQADAAVGTIRRAIAESGVADRTTIILTADHGGDEKTHRAAHPAAWIIPWICQGPWVRSGPLDEVTLLDTAPTVLASLALPPLPGAEGRVQRSCIQDAAQ